MKMLPPVAALLALLVIPAATAEPGQRRGDDRNTVFEARQAGRLLPLDQIVRRVSAQLPGWEYSGFSFDADSSGSAIYKLVFVRDGNVTWIYVDGRTGNTLGRK